jgi:hypothetical protein
METKGRWKKVQAAEEDEIETHVRETIIAIVMFLRNLTMEPIVR